MKFIRLLSKDDEMFSEAMKLYGKSFPSHEQREIESQKEILKDEEYHFDLIYDNDISIRRKSFYTRVGYKENKFNHIHPPYSQLNKGHSLSVMSYPNLLSEIEYDNFNSYLKDRVMNIAY